jgi:hypothetical protein
MSLQHLIYQTKLLFRNIVFRNGLWCFKTEDRVLAQCKWTEVVTPGQHATWTFDDATSAMNESEATLRFSVLETPDSDTEGTHSASCVPTTKGSSQRSLRSRQKSVRSQGAKHGTNKAKKKATPNEQPNTHRGSVTKRAWQLM